MYYRSYLKVGVGTGSVVELACDGGDAPLPEPSPGEIGDLQWPTYQSSTPLPSAPPAMP